MHSTEIHTTKNSNIKIISQTMLLWNNSEMTHAQIYIRVLLQTQC